MTTTTSKQLLLPTRLSSLTAHTRSVRRTPTPFVCVVSLIVLLLIHASSPYNTRWIVSSFVVVSPSIIRSPARTITTNFRTPPPKDELTTTTRRHVAIPFDDDIMTTIINGDDSSTKSEATATLQQQSQPNVGVLLLNLGGPETGDDVEGFLYNLFKDPDIIRLPSFLSPLQGIIAWYISKRRAPKSRTAYESIGGGSPILQYSQQQGSLITQSILSKYGINVKTYIGMRYWHPFTEEALEQIRADQIDALVILPLYPQFSISTSGSSLRLLQEEFAKQKQPQPNPQQQQQQNSYRNMVHTVVPSWYDRPGYIKAMASLLRKEIDSFTSEQITAAVLATPQEKPIHVLFSAHGVPQSYIKAGDPYQQQIIECVDKISSALSSVYTNVEYHLSYQSRVGPIEWLRPYTDDVLPELGQRGVKNLVVVPISFVSEHIETLEEIDIEYRELAEESGIEHWRRCPALNTNPIFIEDMADLVVEALSEPAQTVTEACVANMVSDLVMEQPGSLLYDTINAAGVQGVGGDTSSSPSSYYQLGQRTLEQQERTVSRIAMFGVAITLLAELVNGRSLISTFGNL